MNKFIKTILISLQLTVSFAQEIKSYEWDEKPVFEKIPEKYVNQPAVVLFDKRWIHTRVGQYSYATFIMNHLAVKINKAEEINNYNKVNAEYNGFVRNVKDFHARIIKPSGAVQIIPEDRIVEKEINNVKSIVFEGVEQGDILEYYFIIKEFPESKGIEIFQREIPVLKAEFSTTSSGVNIAIDDLNQFSKNKKNGKTVYTLSNIEPYVEEVNATNFKNIKKLIYNIDYNSNRNWNEILYKSYKKPNIFYFTNSTVKDFIKFLKLDNLSTEKKIEKLETYIKHNFTNIQYSGEAKKIKDLTTGKLKLYSEDIFNLYAAVLKHYKIPYNIVVGVSKYTSDINQYKIIYGVPYEFMYYIPENKKFLCPHEKNLAYGDPMYELQQTKTISYDVENDKIINNFEIPLVDFNKTTINTTNIVNLNEDLSAINIQKTHESSGYIGGLERYNYTFLKEAKNEKELTAFYKNVLMNGEEVKLSNIKTTNENFENNYTNTPFTLTAKIEFDGTTVEDAGNLKIINIGKAIGYQTNLYQEKERHHAVDLLMTKKYKHKIIFNIPNGYKVENLSDLIISKKSKILPNACSFESTAKQEGNQIIVTVEEVYETLHFDTTQYDDYRNTINASSDFYKSSIILKKI